MRCARVRGLGQVIGPRLKVVLCLCPRPGRAVIALSPVWLPGRPAHRAFRGLLGVHSRCDPHTRAGHQFATRYPKASAISSPPRLLRLLPAGAIGRAGLAPTEKRRLVTAHAMNRHIATLTYRASTYWPLPHLQILQLSGPPHARAAPDGLRLPGLYPPLGAHGLRMRVF